MLLWEWLQKKPMSKFEFSKKLKIARSMITQYINGKKRFSSKMCVRIEEETNGEVSRVEAMWPELFDKDWKFKPTKNSEENEDE